MRSLKIKIHCCMCGQYENEHYIDINEYGYFVLPEGRCPYCLAILVQEIKYDKGIEYASEFSS